MVGQRRNPCTKKSTSTQCERDQQCHKKKQRNNFPEAQRVALIERPAPGHDAWRVRQIVFEFDGQLHGITDTLCRIDGRGACQQYIQPHGQIGPVLVERGALRKARARKASIPRRLKKNVMG